jgi:uncharacterized protein (TIGR02284 family)
MSPFRVAERPPVAAFILYSALLAAGGLGLLLAGGVYGPPAALALGLLGLAPCWRRDRPRPRAGTRLARRHLRATVAVARSPLPVAQGGRPMATTTTENAVRKLNALLRGELAATETYQQALAKVGDEPGAADVRRARDDHREMANRLRIHVHEHGGTPDHHSGAWGAFAKAWTAGAKLFGNKAALHALKQGEEHGLKSYESALKDDELPADCKELVRSFLDRTHDHISALDRALAAL